MQVHRFFPALIIFAGALLGACHDSESPTAPSKLEPAPAAGPTALVGASNTWEQVAPMPSARYWAVSAVATNANGRDILYLFGGNDIEDETGDRIFGSVESYNIANNIWTTKSG